MNTLDEIKDRCVIDDETGCWHWKGAMSAGTGSNRVPVLWFRGRTVSALRAIAALTDREIPSGGIVWRGCRCEDCVRPGHLEVGTRQEWGKWRARNGSARFDAEAWAANMRKRRAGANAILDADMADEIRKSSETGLELAKRFGVSKNVISRVRKGKTWSECIPHAFVFTWRGNP